MVFLLAKLFSMVALTLLLCSGWLQEVARLVSGVARQLLGCSGGLECC